MYPDNRVLIERLQMQPFAFVGVMGDDTIDTVIESLETKTITWRVWWDGGKNGSISRKWNVRGWPDIYVLDHNGIIRFKDARGKELERAVEILLAELDSK